MNTHGPVEPDKDNIRQEPYTLPQGFTWDALDLGDRGVVSRPRQATGVDWALLSQGALRLSHTETATMQAIFKDYLKSWA